MIQDINDKQALKMASASIRRNVFKDDLTTGSVMSLNRYVLIFLKEFRSALYKLNRKPGQPKEDSHRDGDALLDEMENRVESIRKIIDATCSESYSKALVECKERRIQKVSSQSRVAKELESAGLTAVTFEPMMYSLKVHAELPTGRTLSFCLRYNRLEEDIANIQPAVSMIICSGELLGYHMTVK